MHGQVAVRIPLGDGRHGAQRGSCDEGVGVGPLDHRVGRFECGVDIADVERVGDRDAVVGALLVYRRGAFAHGRLECEHRRQRCVLDRDEVARFRGDGRGLGCHGGHLVADAAHAVGLQRQVVLPEAEGVLLHVAAGDDRQDARQRLGGRRVDRNDASARHRGAQDGPVGHAGQREIGQVVAGSGHLCRAIQLGLRMADHAQLAHDMLPAARCTASTIFT